MTDQFVRVAIVGVVFVLFVAASDAGKLAADDEPAKDKIQRAKTDIAVLTSTVCAYKLDHLDFPLNLQELLKRTNRGGPYVKMSSLIDPWGRPFLYDPAGTKNQGLVPDLWTLPIPGGKGVICNWSAKIIEAPPAP